MVDIKMSPRAQGNADTIGEIRQYGNIIISTQSKQV